jgi:GMP reductase
MNYNNKFVNNEKYFDFNDVLILPKSSKLNSRSEVNLEKTITFKNNITWTGIPIIAANMTSVGTLEVYSVLSKYKIITALHKFYKLQDLIEYNKNTKLDPNYFMISTGIGDSDYENLITILSNTEFDVKFICIDVANGYIENLKSFCKKIRNLYPNKIIVAGNITTKEGVLDLISCGVDIIKAGIGGGSACTTRIQTGIGMPQFSCVLECSESVKNSGCYIISDGGITCPGDLGKAFGGGADFVMIGGIFAGHDENPGELIVDEKTGEKFKFFYGMSSSYAMKNNYATNNNTHYRSSEGREIKIKYKGSLENTIQNYLGGLRSTCTYTNSKNIIDLEENCKFILVNNQFNSSLVK